MNIGDNIIFQKSILFLSMILNILSYKGDCYYILSPNIHWNAKSSKPVEKCVSCSTFFRHLSQKKKPLPAMVFTIPVLIILSILS